MHLHPRHRIDIGLDDLLWGLSACARRLDPGEEARLTEAQAAPDDEVIAALSVRSAFDLLLTALDLPAGSEVLFSALTIPDMPRLARAHGLVPVPVDIDPTTLSPAPGAIEAAWSPRARMLVVAQLFGGRADLDDAARFAAERGLVLVDDDAQGYTGPASLRGSPADVALHSFGSIKTATCLGGGLARVKNPTLRSRMRAAQARWPVQPTEGYARKLALYTSLLVPREPRLYTLFARACELGGAGLDATVMRMTKGFSGDTIDELLGRLRHRPCGPLLGLLRRRLGSFDAGRVERRRLAGEAALAALAPDIEAAGRLQRGRTHWLFAALLDRPGDCVAPLRAAGFDAARGTTSIAAVPAPAGRPEPAAARRFMERVLFLPVYPEVPPADRDRMARALRAAAG